MKVLLTGASSALASRLAPRLCDFAEVLLAGRTNADHQLDLTSDYRLPDKIDTLVQLAADFGGPTADDLLRAEQVNAIGTLKLYQQCALQGVKHFVYISSIYSTVSDSSPLYSAYSLSKRHAEDLLLYSARSAATQLTIIRPGPFYASGPGFRRHQPFLHQLIDKAYTGSAIELYGTHDALRNYLHADDLALILAEVVRQRLAGSYNCLALENISLKTIAQTAAAVFGQPSRISFNPDKTNIADIIFPIDDTLFQHLQCYPGISFAAGMELEAAYRRTI